MLIPNYYTSYFLGPKWLEREAGHFKLGYEGGGTVSPIIITFLFADILLNVWV